MPTAFQITSPVDGKVYATYPGAAESDVPKAAEKASRAQLNWAQVSLQERNSVCRRFLDVFAAQEKQIVVELELLMGRPIAAGPGEIRGVVERTTSLLDAAETALADEHIGDRVGFDRWISREPLGVVFVIATRTYPYLTANNSIISILLAGNAVLLKYDAQTAPCGTRLAEAFKRAGLPDNLLIPIAMTHDVASKLIASTPVDHVVLTGSVGAGRAVHLAAAERFVGVATELEDIDAARRIDRSLEMGTVFMNRCDYLDPALPRVGVKDTGRGCSLSKLGFYALTRPKSHHYRLSA